MNETHHGPDPGSVGDEAARLVEAVQEWARDTVGEHSPVECTFCPLCRLMAALSADHPDLAVRVGEVTNVVVAAVRGLLEPLGEPSTDSGGRRVEPIDVTG